ncbi:MAG: hypothetical protein JSW40_04990, partial [Candidatus Omnitrophota bacterium]
ILMGYILMKLWSSYRKKRLNDEFPKKYLALYSLGMFSSLLAFFSNCLMESGLQYSRIATFFWFMIALAISLIHLSNHTRREHSI